MGASVGVRVEAFAVDAHRGGDDDALDRLRDQRLQKNGGAEVVGRDITLHRIHALADAHFRGEVHDVIHTIERPGHGIGVAHVAALELGVARQIRGAGAIAMDLLEHGVQNTNPIAAREQRSREMTSDEATAAGDQN